MFCVFKGQRPAGNKRFSTYEQARAYARKLVRKALDGWTETSNPPIGMFGYAVKRVA
jgi:hypothetical protein